MKVVHLQQDHWNDVPETALLNYQYNHSNENDIGQKSIHPRMVHVLQDFLLELLTDRQSQIFKLYYLDYGITQTRIGELLGISQPTVNQHLNGKIRGGKRIGGAHRRIRKKVDAYLKENTKLSEKRDRCSFMELLLSQDNFHFNKNDLL